MQKSIDIAPQVVLNYWFEDSRESVEIATRMNSKWYGFSPELDDDIRSKFGHLFEQSKTELVQTWSTAPTGCIALVIVFDQFSRQIFRGTSRAFAFDEVALDISRRCIEEGWDTGISIPERLFLYNPFQHSESLEDQDFGVNIVEKLSETCPLVWLQYVRATLDFFKAHRNTICRFGRFPHRNKILARGSTKSELEFLKTAPRYGQ